MKKSIVIVCGGEDFNLKKIKQFCKDSSFIIAADSGLNILDKISVKPDYFVGDMDSIDKTILKKYSKIKHDVYPEDKDYTDSELAIQKAVKLNPDEINLFAATGSYFDHSYANIINLFKYQNNKINMKIITKNSEIFILDNKHQFNDLKGYRISIFAVEKIKNLSFKGFKYIFKNKKDLNITDYSISNVITDNNAVINFTEGEGFCVLFDKRYR